MGLGGILVAYIHLPITCALSSHPSIDYSKVVMQLIKSTSAVVYLM